MLRLNIKKEKIFEVLNPKFSWMQKIKKRIKLILKKKKIIFLSELSTGLNDNNFLKNKNYNFSGFTNSNKRTEIVFEELIISLKKYEEKIFFNIKTSSKGKKFLPTQKYKSFIHNILPSKVSINNLLDFDLVIGVTTNMLCELRTINIRTPFYNTPKKRI